MHPIARRFLSPLLISAVTTIASTLGPQSAAASRPVLEISKVSGFTGMFNLGQGTVRAVMVMSPTAENAEASLEAFLGVIGSITTNRLRAYVVFRNQSEQNNKEATQILADNCEDRRVVFFRDTDSVIHNAYSKEVMPAQFRQDVYFVYDTDAALGDDIADIAIWTNGISKTDGKILDVDKFRQHVENLLEHLETRTKAEETNQNG